MSSIIKVILLLLVTQIKSNKGWIHSNVYSRKCHMLSGFHLWCINVGNIETEGTGTISSIVRAYDTDVSQQNRTHNTNLNKIPKAFIEINSRRIN